MIDAAAVAWKEWRELLGQRGLRGQQGFVLFAGAFGIVLPLMNGPAWVTSPIIALAWAWVPMFLVTTVIADAFAGERERHTLETLLASRLSEGAMLGGKVAAAIGYAFALTAVSLVLGLVTVNLAHRSGGILLYSLPVVEGMVALGLLGSLLVAAVGVLISLKAATVRSAQQTLGAAIMALMLIPLGVMKLAPASWTHGLGAVELAQLALPAMAAFAALDAALLALAMKRFRRSRLLID